MKPAPEGAGNSVAHDLQEKLPGNRYILCAYAVLRLRIMRRLTLTLRARVQHRDRTAVLGPAGDVVADRDRAFLAVGNGAHAARIDTMSRHVGFYRLGTAGAERNVVFAGAALVRMTFDGELVTRIGLQPLDLLVQGGDRLRRKIGLVAIEENAVADIDHEVLLAAWRSRTGIGVHT